MGGRIHVRTGRFVKVQLRGSAMIQPATGLEPGAAKNFDSIAVPPCPMLPARLAANEQGDKHLGGFPDVHHAEQCDRAVVSQP